MKFRTALAVTLVVFAFARTCEADVVVLKDGTVVEGDIRGLLSGKVDSIMSSGGKPVTLFDVATSHIGYSKSEVDPTKNFSAFRTDKLAVEIVATQTRFWDHPEHPRMLLLRMRISNSDERRYLRVTPTDLLGQAADYGIRDDVDNVVRHLGFQVLGRNTQGYEIKVVDRIKPEEQVSGIALFEEPLPKTRYLVLTLTSGCFLIGETRALKEPAQFVITPDSYETPEKQLSAIIEELKDKQPGERADLPPYSNPRRLLQFTSTAIKSPRERSEACRILYFLYAFSENRLEAFEALLDAVEAGRELEKRKYFGMSDWSGSLRDISRTLAHTREFELASDIAKKIPDSDQRSLAFADLAIAYATAGKIELAKSTAERIEEADNKAWALTEIGSTLAATGDKEAAIVVLESAAKIMTTLDDETSSYRLGSLAAAFANAGSVDRGLELAEKTKRSSIVVRDIAYALALAGKAEQAEEVADTVEGGKAYILRGHVDAFRNRGEFDRAVSTAMIIESPHALAAGLCEIARAQNHARKKDAATATLQKAVEAVNEQKDHQASSLIDIADIFNEMGDGGRAAELLSRALREHLNFEHSDESGYYRKDISVGYVKAGKIETGIEIARGIDPKGSAEAPFNRDLAFGGIARTLAKSGEYLQALAVIDGLSDDEKKSASIHAIALILAEGVLYRQLDRSWSAENVERVNKRIKAPFSEDEKEIAKLLVNKSATLHAR